MLEDLPVEILQQIIGHLPTASAISHLSLTSRKLHISISSHESTSYRLFVQRAFPSIKVESSWREAAEALTSRSRAWDRRALIARECCPPESHAASREPGLRHRAVFGFAPALDSYEDWSRGSRNRRRETVAWGAAGRIYIRQKEAASTSWSTLRFEDDDLATNDILQLKLLRPQQKASSSGEIIIYRRANDEVATLETANNKLGYHQYARFGDTAAVEAIAANHSVDPVLAIARASQLQLYHVYAQENLISPTARLKLEPVSKHKSRVRCLEYLNHHTVAIGTALLESNKAGPVRIFDVSRGISEEPNTPIWTSTPRQTYNTRRNAHCIASLDHICGNAGQLFLSGWSSGHARLHDTRSPEPWIASWYDSVDNGQILSLATIGHERFVAGSDQNACLKTFDVRMPGERRYSYLDARPPQKSSSTNRIKQNMIGRSCIDRRDFNAFLSVRKWRNEQLWDPLPLPRQHNGTDKYTRSIYSLSIPSPTSPTIYAGIESHVVQVDFVGTDDVERSRVDPLLMDLQTEKESHVFSLGCYERPKRGEESTDPVLLNKQAMWHELKSQPERNEESELAGWDKRWRLGGTRRSSWSRGRSTGHRERRGSMG